MTQDSKKIVNVAKAIYDQLGKANFTRGDVEDLARQVTDKIPFDQLGRNLAVKLVSVGIKAAEAAKVLYDKGSEDAIPKFSEKETADMKAEAEAVREAHKPKTETVEVPPEDVEVMPPKEVQT